MSKAYEKVMDKRKDIVSKVIEMMEGGYYFNAPEWKKQFLSPYNPESKTVYRGGNKFRLLWTEIMMEYNDPRWMTFHQIKKAGYQVKQGQHGVLCEKWIFPERDSEEEGNRNEPGNGTGQLEEDKKKEKAASDQRVMVSYFYVFNAQQIAGYPEYQFDTYLSADQHLQLADELKEVGECPVYERVQEEAFYHPQKDYVMLPTRHSFKSSEAFVATMLHELAHSTGHQSRLNRPFEGAFGSKEYAREELIAELSTLFISGDLGVTLSEERLQDNSNYLKSWIQILNDDPNELFRICADADRASERIVKRYEEHYQIEMPRPIGEELEEKMREMDEGKDHEGTLAIFKIDDGQEKKVGEEEEMTKEPASFEGVSPGRRGKVRQM